MTPPNYDQLLAHAVSDTMADIASRTDWHEEVKRGKMFGVLLATDATGELHTLRAYSGQILGRSDWEGYVPAVFDYLQPDGYFKQHEAEIDSINREVILLQNSANLRDSIAKCKTCEDKSKAEIDAYKEFIREQRATRTPQEAQYQNAELRRLKLQWKERLAEKEAAVNAITQRIDELKAKRSRLSDELQRWLFEQFKLTGGATSLNNTTTPISDSNGQRSVLQIFTDYARENNLKQTVPPAGTGECCAPKLLHYANSHGWTPIAMTEFWYGASPVGEVRHHGVHYEPCQAKCMPLMPWLWPARYHSAQTEALISDIQPQQTKSGVGQTPLKVLYEDDWLIAVDKPAGLLSVPGKRALPNAEDMLRSQHEGFLKVVHRLDMDTSGILLAAKTQEVFVAMQRQFAAHQTVQKEYEAILTGEWNDQVPKKGTISLPLAADFFNRPRQRVDYAEGKAAVTEYEVQTITKPEVQTVRKHEMQDKPKEYNGIPCTSILLRPLTGRTHQLRVHCAHADGLAMPILGDPLYGNVRAERMYLNAHQLIFQHPVTGQTVTIKAGSII